MLLYHFRTPVQRAYVFSICGGVGTTVIKRDLLVPALFEVQQNAAQFFRVESTFPSCLRGVLTWVSVLLGLRGHETTIIEEEHEQRDCCCKQVPFVKINGGRTTIKACNTSETLLNN